jgi:hypothetical protein
VLKTLVYFVTVVPPLIDAVKGALRGIDEGICDVRRKKEEEAERRYQVEKDQIMRGEK